MAFTVFQSEKNNQYYFNLKAGNGEVILQSEGYEQEAGARNGVTSVAKHSADESNFEEREAKDGRTYFVLKASNGEIIGKSQMYKSDSGLKNGIQSVMENAKGGEIK